MTHYAPISVRIASLSDLPSIVRIYNEAVQDSYAIPDQEETSVKERIPSFYAHGAKYPMLIAENDRDVVAWSCISPYSELAAFHKSVENMLFVSRSSRGQGIGSFLLSQIVNSANQLGYHRMIAKIFAHNFASLAVHRKLGFIEMAYLEEIAFINGTYRDMVFLVRKLEGV
jgi:phosphinothricin acetyltransferase